MKPCSAHVASRAVPGRLAAEAGDQKIHKAPHLGREVSAGRLVRLLPDYPPPEQGLHALYPSGRHLSAKVRSFVDFLVARFGGEPAWDRA